MIGDYLVVDQLGRGAYGCVYTVLLLPVFMRAALKLLVYQSDNPRTRANVMEKFEGEALSLAHLSHPNLVRLLKYGEFDGAPYIVMEYVKDGRGLDLEIKTRRNAAQPFEPRLIRHICEQMVNALNAAHLEQIVHRDVKPSNILLQAVSGDHFFVRVLDFGLAKFIDSGGETSYIVGTPYYMAPEQVLRRDIGPWTDLYGVAMIALEMLMGRRLEIGDTADDVMSRKRDPNFDPMQLVDAHFLSPALEQFLSRALSWPVADRFQTAMEFKDEMVEAFRRHERAQRDADASFDSYAELQRIQLERVQLTEERHLVHRQRRELEEERGRLQDLRELSGGDPGTSAISELTRRNWPWISLVAVATIVVVVVLWLLARCS